MQNYGQDYANLLIWQYRNKPKAKVLIEGIVNGVQFFDNIESLKSAFNIKTASGNQLRRIGSFVGLPYKSDILALSDDNYRKLVFFKTISNNANASPYSITTGLFDAFGTNLTVITDYNMHIIYFASLPNALLEIAIKYDLLPRPLGVGIFIIDTQSQYLRLTDSFDLNNVYGIDDIGSNGLGTFIDTTTILT